MRTFIILCCLILIAGCAANPKRAYHRTRKKPKITKWIFEPGPSPTGDSIILIYEDGRIETYK